MVDSEHRPLVLVVEDDASNREVMTSTLTEFGGYRVVTEANGEHAVHAVDTYAPDVVLLDLMLSQRSGLDILRDLRADPRFLDLPVVAVTADVRPAISEEARALGCREFVAKPFSLDQLLDSVARALASPESGAESDQTARG